jgi:AcrR family transcriptional regulator
MPRPELHSADQILDAARQLVLDGGARAATVEGIVAASGAPKGSIYHRFGTLDDLLAAMWLRAVRRSQESFLEALERAEPVEAALAAGLSMHDFARKSPGDARLLASLRREDLIGSVTDPELRRSLREVNATVRDAVMSLTRRLYGNASRPSVERTMCAVIDLPYGAIRRHLGSGSALPRNVRPQLAAAIEAAIAAGASTGRDGPPPR